MKTSQFKEHLSVVIVGHVDHGKSTILGRLLADTGSLPEGKLESVRESCRLNSRPFEYAFLLDALEAEQRQGITIDMARCFFETPRRRYTMIDAPGHIEFLKNMVTGAARAEAALLVIDAKEGIQENSKRHGYMLSMLGVKQVAVLINKFDLVDYERDVCVDIERDYSAFLENIGVRAVSYIPVSGRNGDNIVSQSPNMPWFDGPSVVEQLDRFELPGDRAARPFRMPVQDIYRFTEDDDDRRIVAGTIESGTVAVGDEVVFCPSGKESSIVSIEAFSAPECQQICAPHATGVTLRTQIYAKPGEIMCRKADTQPQIASRFRVNLFWLGRQPMIKDKTYKLKLASARVAVKLADIVTVLDASELSSVDHAEQINRHDIGECVLETVRPIAFDFVSEHEGTGRFVLVDDYEIAGGGVILARAEDGGSVLEQHVSTREFSWERGLVGPGDRTARNHHQGKLVVFTGNAVRSRELARALEQRLFLSFMNTYYLGMSSVLEGLDSDVKTNLCSRDEHIRRLGELARIMTDAGLIFITALSDVDGYDLAALRLLNTPNEVLVVHVGENQLAPKGVDLEVAEETDARSAVDAALKLLSGRQVIQDYCI